MRLTQSSNVNRFGSLVFHELQEVIELESEEPTTGSKGFSDLTIVVPVKNEKLEVLRNVLIGIPREATVIVVSASSIKLINRKQMEINMLEDYVAITERTDSSSLIYLHQKDLSEVNLQDGKGEALFVGTVIADSLGAKYVGYVDADNYSSGSVNEYCHIYLATLLGSKTKSMVRILWNSKPKVRNGHLEFPQYGRVSEIDNKILNELISSHCGYDTDYIYTANAGEHAMTVELARDIPFTSEFSNEVSQLVYLLQKYGGVYDIGKDESGEDIDIFQVKSCNPHFHEERDEEHIKKMLKQSLSVVHESKLVPPVLREYIRSLIEVEPTVGFSIKDSTKGFKQGIIERMAYIK